MHVLRSLVLVAAGAAAGLTACGGDAQAVHCTPRPSPSPPVATAGQITASADRAVVPSGDTVATTVHVTGPLAYQAPCTGPLSLIVIDSTDIHVFSAAPPAPKGTPCGAVTLAAGQSAEYDVQWNADPTLPSGRYRLVLALGDQPQLVLSMQLGLATSDCP
jgi:hypothetical protein